MTGAVRTHTIITGYDRWLSLSKRLWSRSPKPSDVLRTETSRIKEPADGNDSRHQVRPRNTNKKRDDRAITPSNKVRRTYTQLLNDLNRIRGHAIERELLIDVCGVSVARPLKRDRPKMLREIRRLIGEILVCAKSAMQ